MKSRAAETLIPAITEQVDRRKSLLQAAFDVIALSGFEGLRTRAVAQRAGVNISTLHYYFPTKQALIEGLAQFLSGIFASLHAPSPATTGRPALDHLRQEFIDARFYHEHYPELEVVLQELSLRANRDPAVRSALASLVSSWRGWVETFVRKGVADGTFRQDLDLQATIPMLMAIFAGDSSVGIEELENIQRGVEEWLLAPEIKTEIQSELQGVKS
jgi:TetR/AcrR family transcriptional regulator, regulator of cefoperazone and chloramphenicol sensitivity